MATSRYEPKDLGAIFDHLKKADDRVVIAISGSLLEYALEL
jgi:hypothetical protein